MILFTAYTSSWTRATASGIVNHVKELGNVISTILANQTEIIIGKQNISLVQEGDSLFHIAYFTKTTQGIVNTGQGLVDNINAMQDMLTEGL